MRGSAFSDDDGARGWFKRRRQRKRAQDLAEWQTRAHRSAFSESPPRAGAGSAFSEPEGERRPVVSRAKEGTRGNAGSRGKERSRTRQSSRTKPHPRDERAMRQAYASSAQLLPTVPPVPYPASAQQAGGATGPHGAARVTTAPPPEEPKKKKDRGLFWWLIIVFVCFPAGFFLADMEDEVSDPPAEVGSAQSAEDSGGAGGENPAANADAPEAGAQPLASYAPVPQNLAETQAVRTESHIPAFLNQPFVIPAGHVFGGYNAKANSTSFYDTETGQLRYTLPGELSCAPAGDTANMWCTPNYWGNPYASSYISDVPATLRAAPDGTVIWESGEDAQGFAPGVLVSRADIREERFSWLSPTDGTVLAEVTVPASLGNFHVAPSGELLLFDREGTTVNWTVFDSGGRTRGSGSVEAEDVESASVMPTADGWFIPEDNMAITLEGKSSTGAPLPGEVSVREATCPAPQATNAQLRENLEKLLGQQPAGTAARYQVAISACVPGGVAYLSSFTGSTTTVVAAGQLREVPLASAGSDFVALGNGIVLTGYREDSRDATFAFDWNQGDAPVWSVPATITDAVPGYGFVGTDYSTPDSKPAYYAFRAK
ncbi:hypothetical protein [Actinotignum schaalii]|uniref:hypothetical protein n=1 Tax=Actinotignum schaalii TaxID=59505 RepID=UPI000406723A|nr:hypothetical protein [Actinotignum schaalii]AIE82866.1 hypothetical protein FB03_05910 [Actinotignum schaalii]WQN44991.1 hypothetical protein U4A90_08385 [Actinotignum schaalii]